MLKVKYCILAVLVCVGLSLPAGAQCWSWTTNGIPADMDYGADSQLWMAFDSHKGEPAILLRKLLSSNELELWHYDGRAWHQTWHGYIIPPRGSFTGPAGLYFDPNQGALIMMASIFYDFEIASNMAFRFVDNQGWAYIDETIDSCGTRSVLPIYDSKRGRAVLVLSHCAHEMCFLEFDGFRFHYIEIDPEEFYFTGGIAGYNPETEKVILFGANNFSRLNTYEYNDGNWVQVETFDRPPDDGVFISGLLFIPSLDGMLLLSAVQRDPQDPWKWEHEMWVYRNDNWLKIQFIAWPPVLSELPMCFDPLRNRAVLFGGSADGHSYSKLTWELRGSHHCRPVVKP